MDAADVASGAGQPTTLDAGRSDGGLQVGPRRRIGGVLAASGRSGSGGALDIRGERGSNSMGLLAKRQGVGVQRILRTDLRPACLATRWPWHGNTASDAVL